MSKSDLQRGEVWRLTGGEAISACLVLVVQTNPANHNPRYPDTIVVEVTDRGLPVPFHVIIAPAFGHPGRLYARCEQILTVRKDQLDGRLGQASAEEMEHVAAALRLVLAL